jgi:signal transduction histidine kinase
MLASAVKEEALTVSEVHEIIDEASQVVMYSHMLEQKSKELETATAELRAANERLKELDRLKDDFMSTVTHELRTPLTSIRAFSEILRANPELDAAERRRFLDIITKETERLTRLINQVLDMAKIESGRAEWHVARVDMRQAIVDALGAMSVAFQEKGIGVETRLPDAVPPVRADPDRVTQVLLNLFSNAAKFCPASNGRIDVELSRAAGHVRVDVRDNGPGVAPEDQESIFEKFRQVGDTLTGKPQGTGLGLHISRQIVEHFGGRLWVQSRPGEGACFSFTLAIEPSVT